MLDVAPTITVHAREEPSMCDLHDHHHHLPPLEHDEYTTDSPVVRDFIAATRETIAAAATPAEACEALRPSFEALLARRDWLPGEFQRDVPNSGMGGGIGQWLLFRAADRSLS